MSRVTNEREDLISEYPPHPVKWPIMFQGWDCLTFVHWRYQPGVIRPLLPMELELDTFDGAAWIGMTPFILTRLRPPVLPALPWISRFPEMNVRTYVRGPDGERGIWFFSLEADRLAAVCGARLSYGLPYRWAKMAAHCDSGKVEYSSRRHFGTGQASIAIRSGPQINPQERERFLTARFRLYTTLAGRLAYAQVEHPRWPLQSATLLKLEQNVVHHSGVPKPSGEPLAHFSPGVYVRIGRPRWV
ncbi:MAG: DUF2071 domain-containing protein [Acidobacteriaceae bacterium]|nr:DUF2071 domain-containing protein [Acidobacteriaceae bacterium]MBV9296916.1 DUF2071 domain-containing protein [Acidobacteriaceae bacterium]